MNHLLPISGEAAFDLLHKKVYQNVLTPNYPEKTKEVLASAHRALDGWGTGRWDFQRTLKEQLKFFDQDTAAQDRYMADLFALHAEKNVFTADILNLQLERTKNDP